MEMVCLLQGQLALGVNGHWFICPPRQPRVFIPGASMASIIWRRIKAIGCFGQRFSRPRCSFTSRIRPLTGYATSKKRLAIAPPMCGRLWQTSRAPGFGRDGHLQAKFHYLLMECLCYFLMEHAADGRPAADYHEQIVEQVKHYVREYYWEDISLQKMAGIVHYAPGHLNAIFRQAEKMPLHATSMKSGCSRPGNCWPPATCW